MNAKNRFGRIMFICAVILFVLACNLPGGQTSAPVTEQVTLAPQGTPSIPAKTAISSKTPTPTSPPDIGSVVNSGFGGTPTDTPTPSPTSSPTPIPTSTFLPDFPSVVDFGGGGGGSDCRSSYPESPNAVFVNGVNFGGFAILCFTLQGMDFNRPFRLELIGPDGRMLQSPDLFLEQNTGKVIWPQGHYGGAYWNSDGTFFLEIFIWWPISLPVGKWVVRADGDRFGVEGNFMVVKDGVSPYTNVLDPRSEYEIMPSGDYSHPVRTKDNGNLTVVGMDYPANSPVFVLLYRERPTQAYASEYELIQKQVVTSDSNGTITTELSGPFEPGRSYMVYGITDPHTHIRSGGESTTGGCDPGVSCEIFRVVSSK